VQEVVDELGALREHVLLRRRRELLGRLARPAIRFACHPLLDVRRGLPALVSTVCEPFDRRWLLVESTPPWVELACIPVHSVAEHE
jgi:hypothetical protein